MDVNVALTILNPTNELLGSILEAFVSRVYIMPLLPLS